MDPTLISPAALRTGGLARERPGSAMAMVLAAIFSVQLGGALALTLFDELSAPGVALVRLVVAALVMGAWVIASGGVCGFVVSVPIVLLGLDLALGNLAFYAAIGRIPLGPTVALEFLGPLGVALALSRRPRDVLMALVALAGVLVLRPIGGALDPIGVGLALFSGATWAAYILLIRRVGDDTKGVNALAPVFAIAAAVVAPVAVIQGMGGLGSAHVLAVGALVGLLSSVVVYGLELAAIRRIPSRVFGVMMSVEPAVATLAGLAILGQRLDVGQVVGIGLVVAASAAATRGDEGDDAAGRTTDVGPAVGRTAEAGAVAIG